MKLQRFGSVAVLCSLVFALGCQEATESSTQTRAFALSGIIEDGFSYNDVEVIAVDRQGNVLLAEVDAMGQFEVELEERTRYQVYVREASEPVLDDATLVLFMGQTTMEHSLVLQEDFDLGSVTPRGTIQDLSSFSSIAASMEGQGGAGEGEGAPGGSEDGGQAGGEEGGNAGSEEGGQGGEAGS